MSKENGFHHLSQGVNVPLVHFHSLLEYFMEDNPKKLCSFNFTDKFDALLQDSSSLTACGIRHDCCRDKVVWVENHHVLGIIDYTLSACIEVPDQMNIRASATWTVAPRLSQNDGSSHIGLLFLYQQYLLQY